MARVLPLRVQEVEAPALRHRWGIGAARLPRHHGHQIGVEIVTNLVEALEQQPTLAVKVAKSVWKTSDEVLLTEGVNDEDCNIVI